MFAFETGKYEMHTLPGPSDAYSGRKLSSVNCIQWRQSVQFSEKGVARWGWNVGARALLPLGFAASNGP